MSRSFIAGLSGVVVGGLFYLWQQRSSFGNEHRQDVDDYDMIEDLLNLEFVHIPSGTFMMGDKDKHEEHVDSFYMGKHEVTQHAWQTIMGDNPSSFKGGNRPVENVSWDDCQLFIEKLNELVGTDKYRLPTEKEWEYACRAGTDTKFYWGDSDDEIDEYAWYANNSDRQTHPVGQLLPNQFGLYDMSGNVWEWCADLVRGSYRVFRGGSWGIDADLCRSAYRRRWGPDSRGYALGFRLVYDE